MFYRGFIPVIFTIILIHWGCGAESVTYNKDIAPILVNNCAPCHHQGGVAPFALTTYNEAKRKARTIAKVTASRYMPPWPADPGYSHFVGERYLSQSDIELIAKWVQSGAPEGSGSPLATFQKPDYRSAIGKPDLVLKLDTVQLFGNSKDRFFLVKIPGIIPRDTFVSAIEFIAGTPDLVHHFNGHLLLYSDEKRNDVFRGKKKVEITMGEYDEDFSQLQLENDDGTLPQRIHSAVNYLPGVYGTRYPDGIGNFKLSKKFAFVGNDLHFGPSDRNVTDQSVINVFFSQKPPERQVSEFMMGTNGISPIVPPLQIPAGKVSKHETRFRVPEDVSVLTINPHLHLLGKSFLAFAIKPNGDTIPMIRIPRWDFRWQYFYTFRHMLHIPRGSEIVAVAVFDNTAANPDNPNKPPKTVGERLELGGASMRATDEMFQFIITYTAYRKGDENISLEYRP